MKNINRKLATISMIACMLNSVNVIAAEEQTAIGKIHSSSVTEVTAEERATVTKIDNYKLYEGTVGKERVFSSKKTFTQKLKRMFSVLDISALPSKILLETGGLFELEAIQQRNGIRKGEGRDKNKNISLPFSVMYDGLASAAKASRKIRQRNENTKGGGRDKDISSRPFAAKAGESIPSLRKIQQRSEDNFKKYGALPMAVSIINYETVDPAAVEDGRLSTRGGKLRRKKEGKDGAYWQSSTFVDSGIVQYTPEMCGITQMVMPHDMFVSNVDDKGEVISLQSATLTFEGAGVDGASVAMNIMPDVPFSFPAYALVGTQNEFRITANTSGGDFEFHSSLGLEQYCLELYMGANDSPWIDKASLIPLDPAPHCDLENTVGIIPWEGVHGQVVPRVYPASGDTADCNKLNRVMVLLDGIDLVNNRGPNTLWRSFGKDINYFISKGFDVITLNYHVGNTFIQRNGEALRTFMVHTIPTLMDSFPDTTDVALLAGSMGGQVANYGLVRAEMALEEHNTRLFMTLDTEYDGASIPVGLQYQIAFLSKANKKNTKLKKIVEGLKSPAARQLLKNNIMSDNGAYTPDSFYGQYYAEINYLGLPTTSRNVSIANGSGTGNIYGDGFKKNLSHVNNITPPVFIYLNANTDHQGPVFTGLISFLGVPLHGAFKLLGGGEAQQYDVAPGSSLSTGKELARSYNSSVDVFGLSNGLMTYELPTHSFVPTASAIGTGFDYSFYEKCNTPHATITVGNKEVISKEMIALKNGVLPVHDLPYSQACNQPEPVACSRSVFWWDQTFISPTAIGDFCKITDVPAGQAAFTAGQNYYLPKAEPCNYPYTPDFNTGKCRIATLPAGNNTYDAATATIKVYVRDPALYDPTDPSTWDQSWWSPSWNPAFGTLTGYPPTNVSICPAHLSDYIEVSNNYPSDAYAPWGPSYHAVCKLKMSQYDSPADVELVGNTFFLIQNDLCPLGVLDVLGCWMGEAPVGVTPELSGNQFRYSE